MFIVPDVLREIVFGFEGLQYDSDNVPQIYHSQTTTLRFVVVPYYSTMTSLCSFEFFLIRSTTKHFEWNVVFVV